MSLFWTVDSDGERVHRFASEWDGNKGPSWERSRYESEADMASLSAGAIWSRWGLGLDYEWWHGTARLASPDHRAAAPAPGQRVYRPVRVVDYRHQSLTLTVGPWYVTWLRSKPLRGSQ